MKDKIDAETLERQIDTFGLAAVINAMAIIARGKSEHIAENWQDRPLAREWDRAAGRLETVSRFLSDRGI